MIRNKKVGFVRIKKVGIVKTKKPIPKISRIKDRNVKCWGLHLGDDYKRFYAPPNHFKNSPHYLTHDEVIHLKINLEKRYFAKFNIKKYETS